MNRIAVIIAAAIALGTTGSVALTASRQTPEPVAYVAWHEPEPTHVAAPVPTPTPVALPSVAPCQEDEPCWDCATMGNLICGPVAAPVAVASAYVPPKPPAVVYVTGTPVASGTVAKAPAPVAVPTVKPTPVAKPAPTPSATCPPLLHKDGVNITPPNAPAYCVYAQ